MHLFFSFSFFVPLFVVVICVNECVCVGERRGDYFEYNQRHCYVGYSYIILLNDCKVD